MNVDAIKAELSLQDQIEGLSPEETIEVCDAVISEAERLKEIAEKELEDQEDDNPY
jgi:hypothetical protein